MDCISPKRIGQLGYTFDARMRFDKRGWRTLVAHVRAQLFSSSFIGCLSAPAARVIIL